MRRIGLALSVIIISTLPAYPICFDHPGVLYGAEYLGGENWGINVNGVYKPLTEQTCDEKVIEMDSIVDDMVAAIQQCTRGTCAYETLPNYAKNWHFHWGWMCKTFARTLELENQSAARQRALISGSCATTAGSYASSRIPDSGGAGGSVVVLPQAQPSAVPSSGGAGGSQATAFGAQPAYEWELGPDPTAVPSGGAGGSQVALVQQQPPAIPSSGGAGGSEKAPQVPQQVCLNDPKSFGDAQLRLLLADPKIYARLTSLIAEEPSSRKAKTEKNQRAKRVRAPTDADIARANSGMSPEAANAIGTIIGVGMGIGLNNIGRRGVSGAAQSRGASGAAPRRGTFDAPLR